MLRAFLFLLLALCFAEATHDKFSDFFPYFGVVLRNEIEGQLGYNPELLKVIGGRDCRAEYATYVNTSSRIGAIDACYAGQSKVLRILTLTLTYRPLSSKSTTASTMIFCQTSSRTLRAPTSYWASRQPCYLS